MSPSGWNLFPRIDILVDKGMMFLPVISMRIPCGTFGAASMCKGIL